MYQVTQWNGLSQEELGHENSRRMDTEGWTLPTALWASGPAAEHALWKEKLQKTGILGKRVKGGPRGVVACSGMGYNTAPGNLGASGCEENLLPSKRIGPSPLPRIKQNTPVPGRQIRTDHLPLGGWRC